jgi:ATP-binding cassette subfamily B protein
MHERVTEASNKKAGLVNAGEAAGQPSGWPWLLENVRDFVPHLVQLLLVILATVFLNLIIPITNKTMIDDGVLARDTGVIMTIVMIQIVIFLGIISLWLVRGLITSNVASRLYVSLLWHFFSRVLKLSPNYLATSKTGDILERIRDFERAQQFASRDLLDFVAATMTVIGLLPVLWWLDWRLFAAFLLSAIAYFAWMLSFRKFRRSVDARRFAEQARSRSAEIGIMRSIQDIKIAGREEASLGYWERIQHAALKIRIRAETVEQWQLYGGRLISRSGLVAITLIAALAAAQGEMTLGEMMVSSVVSIQLYWQVDQLLEFGNKLQDTTLSLERLTAINQLPAENLASNPSWRPPVGGALRVDGLGFEYPGGANRILSDLTFEVPARSTFAVVGPSGSGKTTLLKLLLGLLDPTAGRIRLGDVDFEDVRPADWRRHCGAVLQEGTLFDATIQDNILGTCALDPAWLDVVVEATNSGEILRRLPEGLATFVAEASSPLSAGQRQRILIARALYKRPQFLLLDEATSALDSENESKIAERVREVLPDATIVVVAHRLTTVRKADHIMVLDNGRIRERGSHEELLKAKGLYSDLYFAGQ